MTKRAALLRTSWSEIAEKYDRELVPKFEPWIRQVVIAIAGQHLPQGYVLAPACGPGQELIWLAHALEQHHIVGIDLAPGMVHVAQQKVANASLSERVSVAVGDASQLAKTHRGAAGIMSCFGLQQMPQPDRVLSDWVSTLAPGGILAVMFWEPPIETGGPWHRLISLTSASSAGWPADLLGPALRVGASVVTDEHPSHAMHWRYLQEFYTVMTTAGPWHAQVMAMGTARAAELQAAFYKDQELDTALVHRPTARLLVLRRNRAAL